MKKVISLLLAVVLLATFAVAAVAEQGVDSPEKPSTGVQVVPGTSGDGQNPTAGIVMGDNGRLMIQNSKGERSAFHLILDVNGEQSFIVGGYDNQPGKHIDEVRDPVIKITFLSSALKANAKAQPGEVTDTNIGYETNQLEIVPYNEYMDIVKKGGTVEDFLHIKNDNNAANFNAAAKALGKEDAEFAVADIFQINMNAAAKEFCKGEASMPMTLVLNETFLVDVGDAVIFAELHNDSVTYQIAKVGGTAKAVESNVHNAPAPKTGNLQFTVDLMNTGVFMILAEKKADVPADPAVGGGSVAGVVPGSTTSPKTGDLGEPVAEHSFPWAMVSVLCLAAAFGVSRLGKKEQ